MGGSDNRVRRERSSAGIAQELNDTLLPRLRDEAAPLKERQMLH